YKSNLIKKVKELGIENKIYILGSRNDVAPILKESDVFALPSKTEGMSNALLEAMALGKPCIISNIEQNTALIKNKVNGLVFSNEKELVEVLNDLKSKKTREKYGKENKKV